MLSLVLLVCVLCAVCLWVKYGRPDSSLHALPPALPGKLPIFGHTHLLFKYFTNLQSLLTTAAELCQKQGGMIHFNFGSELYYLITDLQDALTAANCCLTKHYAFDLAKVWMGDGLIIASEDIWKRHRKLLTPAFSLPVIHGFLDVFNSQSRKLTRSVEHRVGKGQFNHFPYLKTNALETLCAEQLKAKVKHNTTENEDTMWNQNREPDKYFFRGELIWFEVGTFGIDPIKDMEFTQKYMEAVDEMIQLGIKRAIQFWLQNDFIYRLVGLKKKEEEVVGSLHAMAFKVLQEKKATMKNAASNLEFENSGIKYKPFLDLLLELSKNGALTDTEIREEMDTIIAAGFETTSTQLTYTLLQLGAYPEVQGKLYKEVLEVLGPERDVEKDDLNKLVYTNAVLMESLRVFPSVPVLFRKVDKDVPLKNYTMRAGSYCVIFPLATQCDPSWGAESDQFRPERWLEGDFRNSKEFAAFGLGKRACIGRTYAMTSMKVTLAHFIRQYKVTADLSKLQLKYEFVMRPDLGHEICIEQRKE